jgi:hypothetical protein
MTSCSPRTSSLPVVRTTKTVEVLCIPVRPYNTFVD